MPVDFYWKLSEKARKELEIRDGQIFRCGLRIALLAHLVCGFLDENIKSTLGQHLLFVTYTRPRLQPHFEIRRTPLHHLLDSGKNLLSCWLVTVPNLTMVSRGSQHLYLPKNGRRRSTCDFRDWRLYSILLL